MIDISEIYGELYDLGVVASGRNFGQFMNKGESYFSSSISRNRQPSTEALLALVANITPVIEATEKTAENCEDAEEAEDYMEGAASLHKIYADVWGEIWRRVNREEN
jgi:hypothetical protein